MKLDGHDVPNRSDETTHIETWKQLRKLTGVPDFLYVADSKVCTGSQLSFITRHSVRVVSLMPDTWAEAKAFKQALGDLMGKLNLRQLKTAKKIGLELNKEHNNTTAT